MSFFTAFSRREHIPSFNALARRISVSVSDFMNFLMASVIGRNSKMATLPE